MNLRAFDRAALARRCQPGEPVTAKQLQARQWLYGGDNEMRVERKALGQDGNLLATVFLRALDDR